MRIISNLEEFQALIDEVLETRKAITYEIADGIEFSLKDLGKLKNFNKTDTEFGDEMIIKPLIP